MEQLEVEYPNRDDLIDSLREFLEAEYDDYAHEEEIDELFDGPYFLEEELFNGPYFLEEWVDDMLNEDWTEEDE